MWGRLPTFFCYRQNLRRSVNLTLEDIVVQELDALGLDLFDLRRAGSRARPIVEVRIDRRDGGTVTIDDCARASRAIERRIDEGGLLAERYDLQVSSPGLERPLRNAADWRRFVGRLASVNSPALDGRVEMEILGLEGEDGAEVAVLRDAKGAERKVPLGEVTDARLAFRWNQ